MSSGEHTATECGCAGIQDGEEQHPPSRFFVNVVGFACQLVGG